jgi:hypothetical protein
MNGRVIGLLMAVSMLLGAWMTTFAWLAVTHVS